MTALKESSKDVIMRYLASHEYVNDKTYPVIDFNNEVMYYHNVLYLNPCHPLVKFDGVKTFWFQRDTGNKGHQIQRYLYKNIPTNFNVGWCYLDEVDDRTCNFRNREHETIDIKDCCSVE